MLVLRDGGGHFRDNEGKVGLGGERKKLINREWRREDMKVAKTERAKWRKQKKQKWRDLICKTLNRVCTRKRIGSGREGKRRGVQWFRIELCVQLRTIRPAIGWSDHTAYVHQSMRQPSHSNKRPSYYYATWTPVLATIRERTRIPHADALF